MDEVELLDINETTGSGDAEQGSASVRAGNTYPGGDGAALGHDVLNAGEQVGHGLAEHGDGGLQVVTKICLSGLEGMSVHRVRGQGLVDHVDSALAESLVEYATDGGLIALQRVQLVPLSAFVPVGLE